MPQLVSELELPSLDIIGLDRQDALDAMEAARSVHWLARNELGYTVTRLRDVTAVLRDQRFHCRGCRSLSRPPNSRAPLPTAGARVQVRWRARARRDCAASWPRRSRPGPTANRLRPTMRAVVGELVDHVVGQGVCELVADVGKAV